MCAFDSIRKDGNVCNTFNTKNLKISFNDFNAGEMLIVVQYCDLALMETNIRYINYSSVIRLYKLNFKRSHPKSKLPKYGFLLSAIL